jgi:hypothetical protein
LHCLVRPGRGDFSCLSYSVARVLFSFYFKKIATKFFDHINNAWVYMTTETEIKDQNSVIVAGEPYSIAVLPSADSKVVKAASAAVLNNLNLDKLISDLELCKQLIYLASNGIKGAGTPESVKLVPLVTELHKDFTSVCGQADIQLNAIAAASAQIQEQFVMVIELVYLGEIQTALNIMAEFSETARKLAASSDNLAKEFTKLENSASKILGSAQLALGAGETAHKDLQKQIGEFKIQAEKATRLAELIRTQHLKLEEDYQEAREKADDSEKKAFTLSVVGAIFKPIAAGLGAGLALYAGGSAGALKNKLAPSALPEDATKAAADKVVRDKEKEEGDAKEDVGKAKVAKEAAEKALGKAEEDEKDKKAEEEEVTNLIDELTGKKPKVKKDKEEKEKNETESSRVDVLTDKILDEKDAKVVAQKEKLTTIKADLAALKEKSGAAKLALDDRKQDHLEAQGRLKAISEALKTAVAAAGEAGDKFTKMGEDYAEIAASYRSEVRELRKLMAEQVKQEHEALSNVKEYAARMKNAGPDLTGIELACDSLFQAVGALKQIVMILQEAGYFWKKMAAACEGLQGANLATRISAFSTMSDKSRDIMLARPAFKESIINYYAGWKALEVIAKDFAKKAAIVRKDSAADFITNLTQEQARLAARELGGKLLTSVTAGLTKNEDTLKALTAAETMDDNAKPELGGPKKKAS